MTTLTVAVIGVGVLCLLNLWLTIAMARVLRGHGEQLAHRGVRPRPVVGLPPGTQVPDFTVTTVTGATVSAEDLRGERSLIAFLSPGCAPCHEQVPAFAALARRLPGGSARSLAVICSGPGAPRGQEDRGQEDRGQEERHQDSGADHLARELADVAHVVREPSAGAAAAALAVSGFPSFILLDAGGRVEAGAHAVAGIAGTAASA
jgi:thiol-disulfide isomerase/thioredoxin